MLVVLTVLASGAVSGGGASSHDPGESGRAQRVLRAEPSYEPKLENVLVQARQPGGPLLADDPARRAAVQDLLTTLGRTPGVVTGLRSPLDSPRQVSKDRHSGLVTFFVAGPNNLMTRHYRAVTAAVAQVSARHPDVRVVQAGDRSLDNAVDDAVQSDFHRSETISLPITAVILLLVFGSLVAAAVPLLLAAATVAATFGLVSVVGTWVPVNSAASSMILLVGVAVSVDYALFYLWREREERAAGQDVAQALRTSARTSGRVVVVSGVTVWAPIRARADHLRVRVVRRRIRDGQCADHERRRLRAAARPGRRGGSPRQYQPTARAVAGRCRLRLGGRAPRRGCSRDGDHRSGQRRPLVDHIC